MKKNIIRNNEEIENFLKAVEECNYPLGLVKGDCIENFKKIPNNCIDLVLTDIPYGEINNIESNKDRAKYSGQLRKYNKGNADTQDFLIRDFLLEIDRVCKGSIYIFCSIEQTEEILNYFKKERSKDYMARLCVWKKSNPTPSNGQHMWLSGTEMCVFAKRRKTKFNQHCKSNVWEFPNGNSKIHPTQKPLKLFKFLIDSSSDEEDLVLDCFAGSGTTGVACQDLNRRFILMEKDEQYCEIIKKRLQDNKKQKTLLDNQ